MKMDPRPSLVIPAKAGIHEPMDPRMREDDNSQPKKATLCQSPKPGIPTTHFRL